MPDALPGGFQGGSAFSSRTKKLADPSDATSRKDLMRPAFCKPVERFSGTAPDLCYLRGKYRSTICVRR